MFKSTFLKMDSFKSTFSIKDLENLTGIKAHTIRIWEKRYNLLDPERTDTNIRYYDLNSLKRLLNISYLNENGYKISKIAALSKEEASQLVKKVAVSDDTNNHALNLLKLSMLNFDQQLFQNTYQKLLKQMDFSQIFHEVFVPLLSDIGILWQTDTITPAHEHFISTLIRQKIVYNTEKFQLKNQIGSDEVFVLFLPDNEIHELGLMQVNYEIVSRGKYTIMLGPSVPIINLMDVMQHYKQITFISYFTIKPEFEELPMYLEEFEHNLLKNTNNQLWIAGKQLQHFDTKSLSKKIKTFRSIKDIVKEL